VRSAIICATPGESHRGYGIVQFAGDEPLQELELVLWEDDNCLWKLDAPWIDCSQAPLVGQQGTPACAT
jgi:hypothetical protein